MILPEAKQLYNQKVLAGCIGVSFATLLVVAGLMLYTLNVDRENGRYPDSTPISSHTNYTGFPRQFRWDDSYRTADPFPDVYNWYSTTFNLGAENRANGRCIVLENTNTTFFISRTVTVSLCNTSQGQLIFISRTTQMGFNPF